MEGGGGKGRLEVGRAGRSGGSDPKALKAIKLNPYNHEVIMPDTLKVRPCVPGPGRGPGHLAIRKVEKSDFV